VTSSTFNEHVSAEQLQAFLERALPRREHGRIEEHVAMCARCSEEVATWRMLFEELGDLAPHLPHEGFTDRVMAAIRIPEPLPLSARVRGRLAALLPTWRPEHVGGDRLQDFVEGVLPARQMARIEAHLGGCTPCAAEAHTWRTMLRTLAELERFAPRDAFAERVMAGVRIPSVAAAGVTEPSLRDVLAWGKRLVPQTRKAWAAISGVALTPAVTVGLVLYVVFSHPTLTPMSLASFVMWQVTDLVALAGTTLWTAALEGAQLFGVDALIETLAAAPLVVAGGVLAYSIAFAFAVRVLYSNLIGTRPVNGRYAHVSVS